MANLFFPAATRAVIMGDSLSYILLLLLPPLDTCLQQSHTVPVLINNFLGVYTILFPRVSYITGLSWLFEFLLFIADFYECDLSLTLLKIHSGDYVDPNSWPNQNFFPLLYVKRLINKFCLQLAMQVFVNVLVCGRETKFGWKFLVGPRSRYQNIVFFVNLKVPIKTDFTLFFNATGFVYFDVKC